MTIEEIEARNEERRTESTPQVPDAFVPSLIRKWRAAVADIDWLIAEAKILARLREIAGRAEKQCAHEDDWQVSGCAWCNDCDTWVVESQLAQIVALLIPPSEKRGNDE
jgi:hypothetical protein